MMNNANEVDAIINDGKVDADAKAETATVCEMLEAAYVATEGDPFNNTAYISCTSEAKPFMSVRFNQELPVSNGSPLPRYKDDIVDMLNDTESIGSSIECFYDDIASELEDFHNSDLENNSSDLDEFVESTLKRKRTSKTDNLNKYKRTADKNAGRE